MIAQFVADVLYKLSHVHQWTEWEDGGVTQHFEYANSPYPYKRTLLQMRRCETCKELGTRRVTL